MSDDWHGMPETELEQRADEVPPMPQEGGGEAQARGHVPSASKRYARIEMTGNYGALCGNYQEATMHNATRAAAEQKAWALFGVCNHSIDYFDE